MATKYTHLTASGGMFRRVTQNRTYSHVEIRTWPDGEQRVVSWIGRPDLVAKCVAASERSLAKWGGEWALCKTHAEAINMGVRS